MTSFALIKDIKNFDDDDDDDCDVLLRVGQSYFKAHSMILKAKSEYLKDLFNDASKRLSIFKRNITVEIPHISSNVFKLCLK